jgi:hypothetical protein
MRQGVAAPSFNPVGSVHLVTRTHLLNFVRETDTGTASACNIVSVMTQVTRHVDDMMSAPSSLVPVACRRANWPNSVAH